MTRRQSVLKITSSVCYSSSKSTLNNNKPKASEVLTSYLKQCHEPPWTSYFIKYKNITDDQWGKSHFNWPVGSSNYHILRTGCYPYIKYHCTKRPYEDLQVDDMFFRIIKCVNLGNQIKLYHTHIDLQSYSLQCLLHSLVVKKIHCCYSTIVFQAFLFFTNEHADEGIEG